MTPAKTTVRSGAKSRDGAKSRNARTQKKTSPNGWGRWWPLVLGVAITPLAVKAAEILPLTGTGGLMKLRLLYPYAMLLRTHALGFSEPGRESWAHAMLYAQFPLYGFYAGAAMRWKSWPAAFAQVAALHLLGFGALWVLSWQ